MFKEAIKAKGRVTVALNEKVYDNNGNQLFDDKGKPVLGKLIKEETKDNAITDPFLMSMLAHMGHTVTTVGTALRGGSKTESVPPGQYISPISTGKWGIYALSTETPVNKNTKIPPYLAEHNTLSSDVTFFNAGATTTETNMEMVPADARSGYNYVEGDNTLTIEYIKNTGTGTVRSVIFGRDHATPLSTHGVLLGEFAHQAGWILGTAGTAVQHTLDRTILWKNQTTSQIRFLDLLTKDLHSGSVVPAIAGTGLTAANIMAVLTTAVTGAAGSVVANGNPYRVDYTSNVTGTSVTVTLSMWTTAVTAPATNQKAVTINIEPGTTAMTMHPTIVYRPDNNTIEAFVSVSHGMFSGTGGINLKKIVFSNLPSNRTAAANQAAMDAIVATVTDLGIKQISPAAPGQCRGLGFYDHLTQRYYLPCYAKANPVNGSLMTAGYVGTAAEGSFCPGYIFDNNMNIVGEWIAASSGTNNAGGAVVNTGSFCPVRTDNGIAYCLYTAATPYYANITQVLSGMVLAEPFHKTGNNILRVIYSYTVT